MDPSQDERVARLRPRFLAAQLAGDRGEALRVVTDALTAGLDVPAIHIAILQASQYEIGRLWETNVINVAIEHQATAIAQLALATLYGKWPPRPLLGRRVVVSCVEGELHDMGARIAADFLEMEGFEVRLLGASVPTRHLVEQIEKYRPHLVALSVTMTFHLPALEDAVRAIRAAVGPLPIVVGGHAFLWSKGAARTVDAQGFGEDATQLVAEVKRILAPAAA